MDGRQIQIDELVVESAANSDRHAHAEAAILRVLRERGLPEKIARASAGRVADEVMRRLSA
jgi:hypothetical protein